MKNCGFLEKSTYNSNTNLRILQCAAMNMTNINAQLLTIEAARTKKREHIYQAAMLDPHTGSELDIDSIKKMVDELLETHGNW